MIKSLPSNPRSYLPIVIGLYFFLGIIYVLVTPAFEASDEYKHYPVVHHLQNTGKLPVLNPEIKQRWQQEAAQPPLYYIIMAAVTYPLDTSDLDAVYEENSYAFIGNPNQIRNKNLMLHNPTDYAFPNTGSIQAVYLIRLVTLFLGMGTICVAWKIGNLLHNERTALLAAILTAFQPMFIFTNAAVNNDALANLLGASGLYLLLRLNQALTQEEENVHAETQRHTEGTAIASIGTLSHIRKQRFFRYGLPLAVILGLAMLTKLSILGLLLLTGIVMAWHAWRRDWRILFIDGLAIFVIAIAMAAPMFIRNMQLYGWTDPTAVGVFVEVQGTRTDPLTWRGFIGEFGTFYRNYWGQFGGINIAMPEWLYNLYNLLFIVGIIGFFVNKSYRQRSFEAENPLHQKKGWWIIFAWVGIILVLLLRWTFIYYSFQGRLVFPALAGINVIIAAGLLGWIPPVKQLFANRVAGFSNLATVPLKFHGSLGAALFISAFLLAVVVIRPNYAWPESLTSVPATATIDPIRYTAPDGTIELVGIEFVPDQTVLSGGGSDPIDITLYWQAPEPPTQDYLSAINVLGRDLEVVGRVNRHPAWGMIAVSDWEPEQVWQDDYKVWISDNAEPLTELQIVVDMYDPVAGEALPAETHDGIPLSLVNIGVARLGAHTQLEPNPKTVLNAEFAEGITLVGHDMPAEMTLGPTLPLVLTWQANSTPVQDYTIFVQLLDTNNQVVGSGDAEPVNNGEYPTRLWRTGDVIVDKHVISVDDNVVAGSYRIAVGLYDRSSGVRIPLLNGENAVTWDVTLTR